MAVHPALRKRAYTKIPVEEETMFQRSAGEDPMNEFYRIYIPYSKEDVLTTIKQTTQPLRLSNQAYRKQSFPPIRMKETNYALLMQQAV